MKKKLLWGTVAVIVACIMIAFQDRTPQRQDANRETSLAPRISSQPISKSKENEVNHGQKPDRDSKSLSNKKGWSVSYPSGWKAYGVDEKNANLDDFPHIDGPDPCVEQCIHITLGIIVLPPEQQNMTANEFHDFVVANSISGAKVLSTNQVKFAGYEGKESVYLAPIGNPRNPKLVPYRMIHLQVGPRILEVSMDEWRADGGPVSSPEAWKHTAAFEKILGSLEVK